MGPSSNKVRCLKCDVITPPCFPPVVYRWEAGRGYDVTFETSDFVARNRRFTDFLSNQSVYSNVPRINVILFALALIDATIFFVWVQNVFPVSRVQLNIFQDRSCRLWWNFPYFSYLVLCHILWKCIKLWTRLLQLSPTFETLWVITAVSRDDIECSRLINTHC